MKKYKVECQVLVEYEIEAADEQDAEDKAFEKVLNDVEKIAWVIWAKEKKED